MAKKKHEKVEATVNLERLDIEYVGIDDIQPNDWNPNRQSDHEFELLCRSIEEDGFTQPAIIQGDSMVIIDGEHRWRACKALGYDQMPVVKVNMTPEQMRIATLRHNRARGSENIQLAADVLRDLQSLGALDHAQDSLLLDNIEMNVMLDSIPTHELGDLRSVEDELSAAETEALIKQENELRKEKKIQDQKRAEKDQKGKYVLALRYLSDDEATVVRAVIGKDQAKGIIKLLDTIND